MAKWKFRFIISTRHAWCRSFNKHELGGCASPAGEVKDQTEA
jgi:hypothetical protein